MKGDTTAKHGGCDGYIVEKLRDEASKDYPQQFVDVLRALANEIESEIDRLKVEVKDAEQRGYAKAMEAERILYDQSLRIATKDARNDALEEAAHLIECDGHAMGVIEAAYAIRAMKKGG